MGPGSREGHAVWGGGRAYSWEASVLLTPLLRFLPSTFASSNRLRSGRGGWGEYLGLGVGVGDIVSWISKGSFGLEPLS